MYSHLQHRAYGRSKWAIVAAGAAGLVSMAIVSAGPADAGQPQDDQYVAAVQNIYPGMSLDRSSVIANGHVICDNIANGYTFDEQVRGLMKANPEDTLAQAQAEANAAVSIYCPQYSKSA